MLWKCGVGPFYSYIILLINLHSIASNKFEWIDYGYTNFKYDITCSAYEELMCTNLTASSFAQCPISEKQSDCHSYYCTTLHIYHSELYTINKTTIPCYLYNLTLINDHIQNIADDSFGNLDTLKIINLGFNELEQIKKATFSTLQNLKELNLKNNLISSIDEGAFKSLKSLQLLHVNNNKLQELSKYIFTGLDNLKELYLQKNLINSISSETFLYLNKLEVLDLTNNNISVFGPESFAGLINLRKLLLNNNFIKTVPLGTFKNFPHLTNLQLGNNFLSQFKTGSFSNLGELEHLNLSYNNFFTINETVLYPLRKLNLLDLNNNHFTYINYTSLLLHLPNLAFISINDNNWSCQLLTHMLKTFRTRGVDYLFNATKRYTEENVDGIYCTENPTQNMINFSKYNDSQLLNKTDSNTLNSLLALELSNLTALMSGTQNAIKESIDALSLNFAKYFENISKTKSSLREEILNDTAVKYAKLEQLYQTNGNASRISKTDSKYINITIGSSLYIIQILILLLCTLICEISSECKTKR